MSSRLSQEITKLAAKARQDRIHDHDTIKELTMVVGLAYLVDLHPHCLKQLRQHLRAFTDLACTRGHPDLCEDSSKIIEMFDANWIEAA